jgi:hypothetical protein
MMRRRSALAAALVIAAGCGGGGDSKTGVSKPPAIATVAVRLSRVEGGKHDPFPVAITTANATGVFGRTRRSYAVAAWATRPRSACVVNRDRVFGPRPPGSRVRATLDPARGEGGPLGWCPGSFRGTVTYIEAFACRTRGVCHVPPGFPERKRVVARFSFRVHR